MSHYLAQADLTLVIFLVLSHEVLGNKDLCRPRCFLSLFFENTVMRLESQWLEHRQFLQSSVPGDHMAAQNHPQLQFKET